MSLQVTSTVELSTFEKFCCVHGNWITICHAAHLTGDYKLIVNNIHYVISRLLKRYPRIRSRIHIEGYHHSLEILDYNEEHLNANLFYSIVSTNDQSWEEIAENECNKNPYSKDGKFIFPLFHFKLITTENCQLSNENLFHLLLFTNHSTSDGRSGYILINDFLTLVTSSDLRSQTEPVNTQVLPCISELIRRPSGFVFPIKQLFANFFLKYSMRKLNHPHIPVKVVRLNDELILSHIRSTKTNFLFTSTSSTLYTRLHEKCRNQQVTLHGPLLGCLLLAFHHCFQSNKKSRTHLIPFNVDIAVDMRPRLPQSPLTRETIGFCVNLCEVKLKKQLPLSTTSFWSLANKCMRATNKSLAIDDLSFTIHCWRNIMNSERKFESYSRLFPDGLSSELSLSNIGKYPFSCDYNQGQLKLRGLHVVNSSGIYYSTAIFYVTCVGDGQLDFSLSHLMENEKAKEFLNYYVRLVEACADADADITLDQLLTNINS